MPFDMEQYVNVPKSVLSDKSLSLKAKGLYALILSLPSSWNCSLEYLEEETGSGKSALRGAVHELEKYGYLVRHLMKDENGCFAGMDYVLEAAPGGELSG